MSTITLMALQRLSFPKNSLFYMFKLAINPSNLNFYAGCLVAKHAQYWVRHLQSQLLGHQKTRFPTISNPKEYWAGDSCICIIDQSLGMCVHQASDTMLLQLLKCFKKEMLMKRWMNKLYPFISNKKSQMVELTVVSLTSRQRNQGSVTIITSSTKY